MSPVLTRCAAPPAPATLDGRDGGGLGATAA